jgi:hypothetical protein
VSKAYSGAEPVIAAARDGTLYVEGVGVGPDPRLGDVIQNKVSRSTDDGRTWSDVTPPALGEDGSLDGFMTVGNGDSVYASNAAGTTFQLFRSDDKAATWTLLDVPRLPLSIHRHWYVASGPSTLFVVLEALPPAYWAYFASGRDPPAQPDDAPNQGLWFLRSDDKGATWTVPQQIDTIPNFGGQGELVASPDGRSLYVPRYDEGDGFEKTYANGTWYLLSSHDGGSTWKRSPMVRLTGSLSTTIPPLALDDAGRLFFAWSQQVENTSRIQYTFSRDQGASWATPRALPGDAGTDAMVWARARGDGNLSLLWYRADVYGQASKVNASWFVEYAEISAADTDAPSVVEQRVTPDEVHHGNICARATSCGPDEDRSLLDYPWMDFTSDGRAHLVFPSTKWTNPYDAFAVVAVQAARP